MTNRELIEDAIEKIETFKHPDIDAAIILIDSILVANGRGSILRDTVDMIEFRSGMLNVETHYYTRGCLQQSSYSVPASLIDANNPVKASKLHALERAAKEKKSNVEKLKIQLSRAEEDATVADRAYQYALEN